ncbi:MAG: hypothetical protein ACRDHW_11645 [Ktedonobacteraceae bacterium]
MSDQCTSPQIKMFGFLSCISGEAITGLCNCVFISVAQDQPTDPARLWRGRILAIVMETPNSSRSYRVQSLEFPDCDEEVYPEQVVGIELPFIEAERPQQRW